MLLNNFWHFVKVIVRLNSASDLRDFIDVVILVPLCEIKTTRLLYGTNANESIAKFRML